MSPARPLVSVVIPVFNGAPFVPNAVASVRRQTVSAVEIIAVDDGSTDGSQDVLSALEKTHGITWFQEAHGGPACSRNKGIAAACGDYVALLDCDDVWLPEKLEAQLDVMRRHSGMGVVHTDYEVVDDRGHVLERVHAGRSPEPLVQAFVGGHAALPSTLLMRRDVLEKVGALQPELYGSEDSDLTLRLYAVTQFGWIDRVLVRKLQRGHGYRDMAFDEATHKDKILVSRERFLKSLEAHRPLTRSQRKALDREWANYFLLKGRAAQQRGQQAEARVLYGQAIKKAPLRLRSYTRLMRTFLSRAAGPAEGASDRE
jgi:glycosyltransferase involved in cell wall biosynthesis